jgi:uncharacterized protein involved in high-affinity Fe2+ transport
LTRRPPSACRRTAKQVICDRHSRPPLLPEPERMRRRRPRGMTLLAPRRLRFSGPAFWMIHFLFVSCALFLSLSVAASELFVMANKPGERIVRRSMTIEAAYMQPIVREGGRENLPREQSDAYFVANIKAASANPHGFSKFAWIPFLQVSYVLEKPGSAWKQEGTLTAAIGRFGPHYGANVKLDGVGKYRFTLRVAPPADGVIDRLVDVENGITWWEPFEVSWNFTWIGIGKIGEIGASGGY